MPAAPSKSTADITKLSFEEAARELELIVKRLETGDSVLDQAIGDYSRGMALKAHCEKKLADARMQVEKIVAGEGGLKTVPFAADE